MKKKFFILFTCIFAILLLSQNFVSADTGPKPSVKISFTDMSDELCYGTLLSKEKSTGPAWVWDGKEEHIKNYNFPLEIWRKFADYKDSDGYYFLQNAWVCNENKQLNWTYYPPENFKILLYYPKYDKFAVSKICSRYAFDSYFTVKMDNFNIKTIEKNGISELPDAEKSYNFKLEAVALVCRIFTTLLLELIIAFLFKLGDKKFLKIIIAVNLTTQIFLNILLNISLYYSSSKNFAFYYLGLETAVFVAEAVIYSILFKKKDRNISVLKCILYALCANVFSFTAGYFISVFIPCLF